MGRLLIVNGKRRGERLEGKRRREAGKRKGNRKRERKGERNQRVRGRGIRHCQP